MTTDNDFRAAVLPDPRRTFSRLYGEGVAELAAMFTPTELRAVRDRQLASGTGNFEAWTAQLYNDAFHLATLEDDA